MRGLEPVTLGQPSGFASFLHLPTVSHEGRLDGIEKLLIVEWLGQESDGSLF